MDTQQQNALLQDQIDQLEETVATLKSDWTNLDIETRLSTLEGTQQTHADDLELLMSVVTEQDVAIRATENDIASIEVTMLVESDLQGYATESGSIHSYRHRND